MVDKLTRSGKVIVYLLLFLFLTTFASAATIYGTVYDLELSKLKAIVEINTQPQQKMLSVDGVYTFNVPLGNYIIKSYVGELVAEENVSIVNEGDYILDLFLFPETDESDPLNDADFNFFGENNGKSLAWLWTLTGVFVLAVAGVLVYLFLGKRKKEPVHAELKEELKVEDPLLKQVLEEIRKENGRITQKDLRRKFPMSEAKISLVLTELEHKGQIEKVKKGRGNVILLKK
ncbi:hypothetical protein J4417_00905 [Candidatus Woesearchaeota archaeon]|nr:hypothetical protein [Candidatus Woesearchaeota archaeon]